MNAPLPPPRLPSSRGPAGGRVPLVIAAVAAVVLLGVLGIVFVVGGGDGGGSPASTTLPPTVAPATTVPTAPWTTEAATSPPAVTTSTGTTGPAVTSGPRTATYVLDAEPTTFDPVADGFVLDALARVFYETLFITYPDSSTPVPLLAESATPNADRTVWTVALRAGIVFHDGVPFDAAAALANLDRQLQAEAPELAALRSLRQIDSLTIQLSFATPVPDVPTLLSGRIGVMASPAAMDTLARHPVGTSTFRFTSWTPGVEIVATRFDDYWQGRVATETIRFVVP